MNDVYRMIKKAAQVEMPVLIMGESGTGKELVACEIAERSAAHKRPFVSLNTGILTRELVSSELFGHVKGSFTGAGERKIGRFEEADGGTLFLDEIGTMEDRVQVALLRVLESGVFRPVGAKRDLTANVRIIAATNIDLDEAVERGQFRPDLLHRLQVFRISLPPLREQRENIPMLIFHFLDVFREEFELPESEITQEAFEVLTHYHWPGNIRELKNVIAQAVVLADGKPIKTKHIPTRIIQRVAAAAGSLHDSAPTSTSTPAMQTVEAPATVEVDAFEDEEAAAPAGSSAAKGNGAFHADTTPRGNDDGVFIPVGTPLKEVERIFIAKTLSYCVNNKTKAAKTLGISRKTLYDKLQRQRSA